MRPAIPFLELRTQYNRLKPDVDRAIQEVLDSGFFILGPQVTAFEEEFAAYLGVSHALGVSSGTEALRLALLAGGVGPGDEVITTALSAVATVAAIEATGARAVLADVDPITYTVDPDRVAAAVSPRTRAVVPVHLYGQPAQLDPLLALADRRGLVVVEDASQAHGATYRGRKVGGFGHLGCFSFYPTKNLGAYGDGGLVVTGSAEHAERVRLLRNYGERARFEHHARGFNCRLDELQAAVLRVKLRHLDAWNARRRALAGRYHNGLAKTAATVPAETAEGTHVYCSYVIRHPARDRLRQWLAERGVGTSVQYPRPIHLQPAYGDLGRGPGSFPAAERASAEILSLPIFPELDEAAVDRVCAAVADFPAGGMSE